MSGTTIEDQRRLVPNQGIRRSAPNGLVFGLISAVIVGLLAELSFGLIQGLSYGLSLVLPIGLSAGLSAGLLVGLLYGGLACLRHYVLRFLLWRTGSVSWHYVPFLDYAAERVLLRKVGGGYIFLHRLLLDYFAAPETVSVFNEPTEHRQASTPAPGSPSNVPSEPMVSAVLPDLSVPTISLAPPAALAETRHSLPCGHELRTPGARYCSVCGASLTMPHTPT